MLKKKYIVPLLVFILSGCASVCDAPRNILGFSKRGLKAAREHSSYQVYKAGFPEVFGAVVEVLKDAKYYIFTKDEIQGVITVMNIPGVVDTTEVGVFITPLGNEQGVKVELSSRSTPAKRAVAAVLFSKLKEKLGKV